MKKILYQDLKALIDVISDAESQRMILSHSNVDNFFWRGANGFYSKIEIISAFYEKYLTQNEMIGKILDLIFESSKKVKKEDFEKQIISITKYKDIIYEMINLIERLDHEIRSYYSINTLFQFSNITFNGDVLFSNIDSVFEQITWSYIPESAKTDIVEGGKALLFGLPTCASFMFIRALEDCIRKLCKQLGSSENNIMFGQGIGMIEKEHEKFSLEKREFDRQISLLKYIKDEFRNPSAHPDKSFTQKEAEQLFQVINVSIDKIRYLCENIKIIT